MQNNSNRNNLSIITIIVISLISIAYFLSVKNHNATLAQLSFAEKPSIVPYFDWFEDIDAPQINNRKELDKEWSLKKRCCGEESKRNNREFYKACYIGMQHNPADKDLEAHCLWLMDVALESRKQFITHNEVFIKKHFYFDKPTDNCANCAPANTSARIAQQLARMYQQNNQLDKAVRLLERMNDERADETSDWVLAENTTQLAEFYLSPEYEGDSIERIQFNYLKLKPNRNSQTLGKAHHRFEKLEKVTIKLQKTFAQRQLNNN